MVDGEGGEGVGKWLKGEEKVLLRDRRLGEGDEWLVG